MKIRRTLILFGVCILGLAFIISPVSAKKPSLDKWKPDFDPSGARYKCIVSNVSHPAIKGVYAGFAIRDELWKRTGGQIYIDFKPFSILGGEVEVLNQLQMGAIQGMGVSSVASTNLGPRFGLVNLPFLINTNEKLDRFIQNEALFNHFLMAMDHQGISGLGVTTYGSYGWATTQPIRTLSDIRKAKFRIAEAAVNQLTYKSWGVNPIPMPWTDVPVALKQGVITALDHTDLVCDLTRKFEVAKYFTQINYAKGLFIWIFNKGWLNSLPADLQKTFRETVKDVTADYRQQGKQQEVDVKMKIREAGIEIFDLSDEEMATLRQKGDTVHRRYADEINQLYPGDVYRPADYLKEVQDLHGVQPK